MFQIGNIKIERFPVLMAPMEDISDPPFRRICKRFGADIVYTEFISSDGLIRDAEKSLKKLEFDISERPVGIQIFGNNADSIVKAAQMAETACPDLIDINFGCPVRKVAMKGGGAGLLKNVPEMVRIVREVVKATSVPVSAKTRLGWDESTKNIMDVTLRLQDAGISAITIHGRTRSQMYKGCADWQLIGEVKSHPDVFIPVIGNGDITSGADAVAMKTTYGVDGIMVGRAMIGNPWIFRDIRHYLESGTQLPPPTIKERVEICLEHLESSIAWKGEKLAIFEMRKHYSQYFKGIKGAKEFRTALVQTHTKLETEKILKDYESRLMPD